MCFSFTVLQTWGYLITDSSVLGVGGWGGVGGNLFWKPPPTAQWGGGGGGSADSHSYRAGEGGGGGGGVGCGLMSEMNGGRGSSVTMHYISRL
jgi:hypothetical protein